MAVKNAKKIIALRRRKIREAERRHVIEGIRLAEEALRSAAPVEQLVFCRDLVANDDRLQRLMAEARQKGILIQDTDWRAFKNMGESQTPEGVLGVVAMMAWERDRALDSERPVLLLDRVRDPGNLGLILRTAEASGLAGVFVSSGSVELYNPKVVRASRGAIFRVPTFVNADLLSVIGKLKDRGARILSAQMGGVAFRHVDAVARYGLILGNETFGVAPDLDAHADLRVTIPMAEGVDSINVAVAAGVLLFGMSAERQGSR
jgi:TrmH family RNA methyltransferase